MHWYLNVLRQYAVFSGRARRAEYWFFVLFNLIIAFVLGVIDGMAGFTLGAYELGLLGTLYGLAVFLPSLAVAVRRLHDTGRTGWWLLIGFIPIIGFIVLLIFLVLDSDPGPNEYGPNPKAEPATA